MENPKVKDDVKSQGKAETEGIKQTKEVTVEADTHHNDKLYEETLDVEDENSDKNKPSKLLGIALISAAVLIILIVVYFFIFPSQWRSLTGQSTYVSDKIENADDNLDVVDNIDVIDEKATGKENTDILDQVAEIDDQNTEPESVDTRADIEPVKKEPKAIINSAKWGLQLPCFVISHSAYSTEETAKQIKAKMSQKGFKTGYFYIPDLQPGGKPLFKVFVGPFNSREDAEKILASLKKDNSAAYVTRLEK